MNSKRPYRGGKAPEYLHEVAVTSGSKTYRLRKGQYVSVNRRPGLYAGRYEFLYGERTKEGVLLMVVEGPESRRADLRYRKTIRESDIKQVHIKTVGRV